MSEYIVGTDDHEGHWLTGEKIVRCRDCKDCREYDTFTYCWHFDTTLINPDGFCAWGVRRDA